MLRSFYQKHRDKFDKTDGFLEKNIILQRGMVIAPIIVVCTNLLNGLILSIAFFVITTLTVLMASFITKKVPYTIRVILYTMIASLIFIPTSVALDIIFPNTIFKLEIFLPLLVTNSAIVIKSETRFHDMGKGKMFLSLFMYGLGFLIVACLVGGIREFLEKGTLLGEPFFWDYKIPTMIYPFSGFILLGVMAAFYKKINLYLKRKD